MYKTNKTANNVKYTDNSKYAYDTSKRKKHPIDFNAPKSKVNQTINEWIINTRDKEVSELRFLERRTFEEIADLLYISPSTVKRIAYRCGEIIQSHVND